MASVKRLRAIAPLSERLDGVALLVLYAQGLRCFIGYRIHRHARLLLGCRREEGRHRQFYSVAFAIFLHSIAHGLANLIEYRGLLRAQQPGCPDRAIFHGFE